MAIKRCPYCKSIIEESEKYCNNCGTQLLFPEDELVEEDIPGEKITDDEFKDEELKGDEDLDKALDFIEDVEDLDLGEGKEEEEVLKEEEKVEIEFEGDKLGAAGEELPELEPEPEVKKKAKEKLKKPEKEKKIIDKKDEIAKLLSSFEQKPEKKETPPAEEKILEPLEGKEEVDLESQEELPPWAEIVKETPPSSLLVEDKGQEKKFDLGESLLFEEKKKGREYPETQTGLGIPETVDKLDFAFGEGEVEKEEETKEVTARVQKRRGPLAKIFAVAFDLLLIITIWLGTLWGASHLISVSVFKIISESTLPVVIFLAILLGSYFFLFLYFLGETLGDRFISD